MKKRTMLVVFAALLILTAALLIGLSVSDGAGGERVVITLPVQGDALIDPTPDIGKDNAGKLEAVTVGRGNAVAVAASLSRPAQYSLTARASYYFDDGSAQLTTTMWVRPDLCLARQYDADGALRVQSVLSAQYAYLWGAEGGTFYQGAAGDFTPDELGRLPSYEDVLALPPDAILDGALVEREGELCLYLRSGDEGRYTDWYISLENGLLRAAAQYEDGALAYAVELTALAVGDIPDSIFLLPNNTMPE